MVIKHIRQLFKKSHIKSCKCTECYPLPIKKKKVAKKKVKKKAVKKKK